MELKACLPLDLQGQTTTIIPIAAGLSGAGVFWVEAAGQAFVLKISSEGEALANWRRKLHIQQLVADAGLAPRVAHMDEGQRAILSDFVVDRSFPAFYNNPLTHETALMQLGRMVRRIHGLPCRPRWR